MAERKKAPTGLVARHSRACASRAGGNCNCTPAWEAWVYSRREGRKIRKRFSGKGAFTQAKDWRAEAHTAVRKHTLKSPTRTKVAEAAEEWLKGAREGIIRPRSGDTYKPSAIRAYEAALRLRVLPEFGHWRLSELTRLDLQEFVDRMVAGGSGSAPLNPSTIGVTLLPLRAIYRRAINRGEIAVNPTAGLELPRVTSGRDRVVAPEEAARLIGALPTSDRALWATAMYAGLRRGELQALRWSDVDLAAGVIHVRRSWDAKEGFIPPKSKKGIRKVPVPAVLRDHLVEHRMGSEHEDEGLVFGSSAASPFQPTRITDRARKAWAAGKLDRIVLHEARHTFASLMIAAGVNAKALSTYMGHANISITLDLYGHLMPGNEDEAAGLLDAYLERANTQARLAQIEGPAEPTGAQTGAHPPETAETPAR